MSGALRYIEQNNLSSLGAVSHAQWERLYNQDTESHGNQRGVDRTKIKNENSSEVIPRMSHFQPFAVYPLRCKKLQKKLGDDLEE